MAQKSWPFAMAWVFQVEGGYVNHPADPGGPTNMGITLKTLRHWLYPSATEADVARLTRVEAEWIYRQGYWLEPGFGLLPAGLDFMAFDCGILNGPERATGWTLEAARERFGKLVSIDEIAQHGQGYGVVEMLESVSAQRLAYLKTRPGWARFGAGWSNRCEWQLKRARMLNGLDRRGLL